MNKTVLNLSKVVVLGTVFLGTQLCFSPFVWPEELKQELKPVLKIAHGGVHDKHEIQEGSIEEVEAFLEQLSDFSSREEESEPALEEELKENKSEEYNLLFEEESGEEEVNNNSFFDDLDDFDTGNSVPSKKWTDDDFFGDDSPVEGVGNQFAEPLEPLAFYQARDLYKQNCTGCHPSVAPSKYTLEQWPALLSKMGPESGLNTEQLDLIYRYIVTSQMNPELENTEAKPEKLKPEKFKEIETETALGSSGKIGNKTNNKMNR